MHTHKRKRTPDDIIDKVLALSPTFERHEDACVDIVAIREFTGTGYALWTTSHIVRWHFRLLEEVVRTKSAHRRYVLGMDGRVLCVDGQESLSHSFFVWTGSNLVSAVKHT